jgi:hypothetical protein
MSCYCRARGTARFVYGARLQSISVLRAFRASAILTKTFEDVRTKQLYAP